MAIKRVLSPVSILRSLLRRFSSVWKFTGEIVSFAPLIVGTLFEKLKAYLSFEDIGNKPNAQTQYDDAELYCIGQ